MRYAKMAVAVVFFAATLLTAGCGGHEFLQRAPAAIAEGANQLETGIDEYHTAAVEEFDRAAARQRAALQSDLAEYVVQVLRADVDPETVTVADVAERLADAFARYEDQQTSLDAERAVERKRYTTMMGLCDWMRKVSGQIVEIETRRYATLDELRDMAAEYASAAVREKKP